MSAQFRQFLAPPALADEARSRAAGLLHWLLLPVVVLALLVGLAQGLLLPPNPDWRLIFYAGLAPLAAGAYWLARRGRVTLAGALLTSGLWITITWAIVTAGGLRAPGFAAYVVVITLASLLLGRRAGLLFLALTALSGLAMAWGETQGLVPPPLQSAWLAWLQLLAAFGVVAAALYLTLQSADAALARAHREIAEPKPTEAQLREAEAQYRHLVERLPIITYRYVWGEANRITFIESIR